MTEELNNTTYSNAKAPEPLTLESLGKIFDELEESKPEPAYKLVMLCKKHHTALMKELKQKEQKPIAGGVMTYFADSRFYFKVVPYLKKIRIIDIPKLEMAL